MKKLIFLLFFTTISFSQTAIYNKITSEGKFTEYQSKNGSSIKVGDTLSIGLPANGNQFIFITQGNVPGGTVLANTKNVITKIRTAGNTKRGFKTYALFSGYGLSIYAEIESALETGEIKEIISHNQTN